MKVEALMNAIEMREDKSVRVLMSDMEVAADCSALRVSPRGAEPLELPWDEQAERAVAQFLKLPKSYLHRCAPEFRAHTVNHWISNFERADAVVEYARRDNETLLLALQNPDKPVVPLGTIGEIIGDVFEPEDEVVKLERDDKMLHIDVVTKRHQITVPDADGIPDRQGEVGDITLAGVRFRAILHESKPQIVQRYFHRLRCTNGMTDCIADATIKLRGKTVDDVTQEMEDAARKLLGDMDERLAEYAAMADQSVPGNPAAFAFAIAQEAHLGSRVTERIMARAGALPVDLATLYDVANIFTETAQSGGLAYKTQVKMQEVAGQMAFATEATLNRCAACEKPLDA